jgi:hypothetical protein
MTAAAAPIRHYVATELEDHGADVNTIVKVRQDLRLTKRYASNTTITSEQALKLACAAMIALGEKDELNPHKKTRDEWVTVGPYVSNAVAYVIKRDLPNATSEDRELVLRHALLINVASRGC